MLSFVIKATGKYCNLDCKYCFYRDFHGDFEQISLHVVERILQETAKFSPDGAIYYWHGGEPFLLDINFYREVIEEIEPRFDVRIRHCIQTNGTLITPAWAEFLRDKNFGVGISLDGPSEIHNFFRVDKHGTGTFDRVISGIRTLQDSNIPFGALAVIHSGNVGYPDRLYNFFVSQGIHSFSTNPCYKTKENTNGVKLADFSISPTEYAKFLIKLLDLWLDADDPKIDIWNIREPVKLLLGGKSRVCPLSTEYCTKMFTVEPNGDIYGCDCFYPSKSFKMGNIVHDSLDQVISSAAFVAYRTATKIPSHCKRCDIYQLCRGSCSWARYLFEHQLNQKDKFCSAQRYFTDYLLRKMNKLIEQYTFHC